MVPFIKDTIKTCSESYVYLQYNWSLVSFLAIQKGGIPVVTMGLLLILIMLLSGLDGLPLPTTPSTRWYVLDPLGLT